MSRPWMRIDPESGFSQADDELQQYALTGTTAPQHRQGLATAHSQADPVQNLLTAEGLMQVFDGDNWSHCRHPRLFLASSQFDRLYPYLFREVFDQALTGKR